MNKLTFATGVALASLTVLAKTQITPPTLASKEYTGQKQTADVPSSADWIVAPGGNAGGTDAGGYSVMLILTDEDSCEWKPTTGVEIEDAVAIVPFAITKANNSWTTEPSINGWKWGETKSTPVAAAKFAGFGEPSVTYSGTAVDGTAVSGATSILAAGTYTATFKVADTPNYAGLSQDVDFEVTKGDISGGGGGGGGSGVTLIAEGFEGPYDGNKHTVTVSVTGAEGETFDITYSNEENGTYSPTKPSYKNVGSYTVWYKINSKSYAEYRSSLVVKINAAVVTPPAISPKVYTGEKQVADVAESALYETVVNLGGKDVNSYDVILQLNDSGNYVWKPTQGVEIDGELATLAFAITKAENSWLVQPSMEGWEWGKTASTPVGQSKFGNPPTLTYNGTKADGTPVSGATSITAPGQYTAVFTVADTANYAGLTESVPFVVTLGKINVDPSDPTEPKLDVEGFEGPYDGENHTITVRIEGAGSEQFNITYSKTGVGEYVAENPQFKNVCDTKVWYAINSPNFTALTNSAPMKITKAAFPGGGEEPGGGEKPAGGVSKFDTVAMYDGEGWTIKTNDLIAAVKATLVNDFAVSYAVGESGGQGQPATPWSAVAPAYTNVGESVVWYKVASANYEDFAHEARVTVTNRPVTLTSGTQSFDYDGNAHSNMTVTVGGEGFVTGEGVTSNDFATITQKGTKPNAFSYELVLNPGSVAENYFVTCVTGMLTVASVANAWIVEPTVTGKAYDGTPAAVTMGTPKFGTVSVTYDGGQAAAPVGAGEHTAKFTVAATEDYGALERVVNYTVTKAAFPGGGEEPGGGEKPAGGVSKFDTVAMYDGEGWTIKTNDLIAAVKATLVNDFAVSYAVGENGGQGQPATPWSAVAPDFTNVCVTSVWYRVVSANYQDFVHEARVTVTNRPVTLTSGTQSFDYDGNAHSNMTVTVSGEGFVAGEGVMSNNFATITQKGTKPNAFGYELILNPGSVAENYFVTCVTGTLTVAAVANAWIVEPTVTGKAYDGTPAAVTMGTPRFGTVSVTYDGGQAAAPVGAGEHTAKFTVAATEDYGALERVVNYTVTKAAFPGGGEEPGGGEKPAGGVSKFDTVAMYDGKGHTIKTNEMQIAFSPYTSGEDAASPFRFAASSEGPWGELPTVVTNVGTTSVWYKFTSVNYEDFVHEARVTVTNRLVTLTSGTQSFDYDGNAHSNMTVTVGGEGFVAGEGVKSNNFATITEKGTKPNAFGYELILNPGSVAENYFVTCVTGTLTVVASPVPPTPSKALLTGEIAWKLLDATGTYFAQLRVVCTSGLDVGVSDLRLLYADEVDSNGKVLSALWSTPLRAANPVEFSIGGRTYRSVVLDASALSEERTPAVYGITDLTGAGIPTDERTIEMYVNSRRYPASCILTWVSGGEQMAIVIEDNPPLVVSKTAEAEQIASEAVASTFLWAEDDPFESLGANTYDGFLCDEDGALQGTVSVKTAKKTVHKGVESVKVTATVVDLAGKKWSYKNGQVSSEGLVSGLLCTKKTSPGEFGGLLLGRNGMMGTWGGFKIVGSRNGMGKKGDVMQSMMQFYKGKRAIDVLLELNDGTGLNCRLTQLKIGAKGRTTVTGRWTSGKRLSVSAQIIMGDYAAYLPIIRKRTRTTPALAVILQIEETGSVRIVKW